MLGLIKLFKMNLAAFTNPVLDIQPAVSSSANDFDFLEGKWKVHNRKLKERLANCSEWNEFPSVLHMRKVLIGLGNVENY